MSLARRSQDLHAQWNDGTNSGKVSSTMHVLLRLDDRCGGIVEEVGMEERDD
jgi:hypothetical protein